MKLLVKEISEYVSSIDNMEAAEKCLLKNARTSVGVESARKTAAGAKRVAENDRSVFVFGMPSSRKSPPRPQVYL